MNVALKGRLADCHPVRLSTADTIAAPTPVKSWGISLNFNCTFHCRTTTLQRYAFLR